jgi:hypothetical protein
VAAEIARECVRVCGGLWWSVDARVRVPLVRPACHRNSFLSDLVRGYREQGGVCCPFAKRCAEL